MSVRILFAKTGAAWIALDNATVAEKFDLSHLTWTVAFDGRSMGTIKTFDPGFSTPYEWTYSRDRLFRISDGQSVHNIRNMTNSFEGWCNTPAYRPLVLVNRPNYKDPGRWKSFHPDVGFKKFLFNKFKTVIGAVANCSDERENNTAPYNYTAKDLIIYQGYQNITGQKLISVGLDSRLYRCDGPMDPTWTPHWFLIKDDIYYIGDHMSVIDAGDYDNDGKSEMIFWHSGYDEDGYTLFYKDFRNRVDYYWKYH
jgi:hypothetical protein